MSDSPTPGPASDVRQRAEEFVAIHGRNAVTVLVGGALAVLGVLSPLVYVNGGFGAPGNSWSIMQSGFDGIVLLLLAIALGALPVFFKQYARFTLAAFGAASGLLGIFLAIWILASGPIGAAMGTAGGFGIGFYCSLLGYAAMVVGYYMLVRSGESQA